MNIVTTIAPVFLVIFVGWAARRRGFFSQEFIDQANRLVYNLAIPAMVFESIAGTDLKHQVDVAVTFISIAVLVFVAFLAWIAARIKKIASDRRGTFIQSTFHGNLGYIGFAVVFYYLGPQGLVKAAILAGFVMIVQNIAAVFLLQHYGTHRVPGIWQGIRSAVVNPVILAALAAILFSVSGFSLNPVIERSLVILKGMALPLALLIIGASLSFRSYRSRADIILLASVLKLVVMPGLAWICFWMFSIPQTVYLPALILLGAPSATMTYVLAREIGGDPDLAGGTISFCTLLSAGTYIFWLNLV